MKNRLIAALLTAILIIALLSLLGALIEQYTGQKELYQSWLENSAKQQYGLWTPMMGLLQLFRIFHSIWFLMAGGLLVINIMVCSLNRWKRISLTVRGGQIVQAEDYYQAEGCAAVLNRQNDSAEAAMSSITGYLKARGYRVRQEVAGDKIYIAADKNRYFRMGTYLTHFSLILFVVGFLVSGSLGYRDDGFTVAVGGVENVGDNSSLSLKLLSFNAEFYPETPPRPKDFRSEVILYDAGKPVKQATIQVNHPLSYGGYRFFQSFYGSAVQVQIKNQSGQTLFNNSIALNEPLQISGLDLVSGFTELPQAGLDISVIKAGPGGGGTMIKQGELVVQIVDHKTGQVAKMGRLPQGTPTVLNDLEFNYLGDTQYSGFQVARDPGENFIWAASILILAGLVLVFYFPLRQLWVMAIPVGPKSSRVLLRTTASRAFNAGADLANLVKKFESTQAGNEKKG